NECFSMRNFIIIVGCSLLLFLVGCGEKSTYEEEGAYQKIASAPYALGFDIMNQIDDEKPDENVFISPASIFMTLAMLSHGADGKTKTEIEQVLHMDDLDDIILHQSVASYLTALDETSNDTKLEMANAIW